MPEQDVKKANILGTESIPRLMVSYAIPSVVSMLVTSLYNIIDQIFIGRGIGFLGNAATTVCFPLITAGLALSLLAGQGAAASISLALGRGESKDAKRILGNALFMVTALSLVFALLSLQFLEPLLKLLGATEAVMPYAVDYTGFILVSIPFSMICVACSHVIRADGSPRYSMFCMLSGAVLNTILDPIFIFVFGMGMKGVAIATIISQGVSFAFTLYYLRYKAKYVRISLSDFKPNVAIIKKISALGSSSFVNQVSFLLVTIVLNRSLIHYGALSPYGSDIPLAAMGIVMKINAILISVILGISIGLQPIIGFNYGAKNFERVRKAFRIGVTTTGTLAFIVNILFVTVPQLFIGMFGESDPVFNEFACLSLRIFMALVTTAGIQIPATMLFMATGRPLRAMFLTMTRSFFAVIPFTLIFPIFWGLPGVLYANPAADMTAFLVTLLFIAREWKLLSAGPPSTTIQEV